jgi:hypothetical protein
VKEFRSYHHLPPHGTPLSIREAGYYWAVFQPHLFLHKPGSVLEKIDYGPTWVARRRFYGDAVAGMNYSYDLLTPDAQALLVGRGHGVFWDKANPPPPVEYYWPDRTAPDWFVKKGYDLFYPLEDKRWYARAADGKWDVIGDGKLVEQATAGPKIEVPRIIFTWRTHPGYQRSGSMLPNAP